MTLLKIAGGTIYDPINGVNGVVMDLWIRDGKIVAPPGPNAPCSPDRVFDAAGLVVMPGGVDMHAHIAGPKVNLARKLRPEDRRKAPFVHRTPLTRSGTVGSTPSTFATGYLYAGLGYTTAFDAAIPPLGARHAHEEFHDTPLIDKGFFLLFGNNHYVMRQIADKEPEKLRAFVGWLLDAAKGYAVKLVNPGGVEQWKSGLGNINDLDTPVHHFGVTARQIITELAQTAMDLGLPHPVHIHCNNLGIPGNWKTTLATMQALEGRRAHLTHIQFHSYGGEPDDQAAFCSQVPALADYVNGHLNLTVDVGQVLFGDTTSMTGDGPLGYYLHKVTGHKWANSDTEMEAGCGIVPITYKEKSFVHALQWAIGLEWYLLVQDPWRIAMSTDHPNGGSFLAYPEIVQLLMDRTYRQEVLKRVPAKVLQRSTLKDLDREYSLYEIAIITRAAPARILGLPHKGHLGVGADADVAVYTPGTDKKTMFELPRWVIKNGVLVVEQGELRAELFGHTLHVAPQYDEGVLPDIRKWFEAYYTVQFANYPVDPVCLSGGGTTVPCRE
jgi:formylmethanofuran dehydrogenase subunit A